MPFSLKMAAKSGGFYGASVPDDSEVGLLAPPPRDLISCSTCVCLPLVTAESAIGGVIPLCDDSIPPGWRFGRGVGNEVQIGITGKIMPQAFHVNVCLMTDLPVLNCLLICCNLAVEMGSTVTASSAEASSSARLDVRRHPLLHGQVTSYPLIPEIIRPKWSPIQWTGSVQCRHRAVCHLTAWLCRQDRSLLRPAEFSHMTRFLSPPLNIDSHLCHCTANAGQPYMCSCPINEMTQGIWDVNGWFQAVTS